MLARRTLLASGAAFACADVARAASNDRAALDRLEALTGALGERLLDASPETATALEFHTGERAALRGRLDDRSAAGRAALRRGVTETLASLSGIGRARLTPEGRRTLDVARFACSTLADGLGHYGYIDYQLRPSPYVVSQMNGAYYWLSDVIGS